MRLGIVGGGPAGLALLAAASEAGVDVRFDHRCRAGPAADTAAAPGRLEFATVRGSRRVIMCDKPEELGRVVEECLGRVTRRTVAGVGRPGVTSR